MQRGPEGVLFIPSPFENITPPEWQSAHPLKFKALCMFTSFGFLLWHSLHLGWAVAGETAARIISAAAAAIVNVFMDIS